MKREYCPVGGANALKAPFLSIRASLNGSYCAYIHLKALKTLLVAPHRLNLHTEDDDDVEENY